MYLFNLFFPLLFSCTNESEKKNDDTSAVVDYPWPDWSWDHWVWEDESTQESAIALVDGYLDRDIPVGAIIIDSPWATGYSTYEWDTDLFPDPQGMIDYFHDKGVRVIIWTVPGINVDVEELYQEASDNDFFLKFNEEDEEPAVVSWWKGDGSLIDYFNPDAVDWWHGLVDKTLDYGIDGWKCDGLDYSALMTPYSPGAQRDISRLEYSHAYYQDFYDYTRLKLGDDRLITARPVDNYGTGVGGDNVAFAPIDISWAAWVGDQDATFDGIKAALNNMYYSAEYGYFAFGSDIGGYRDNNEYPEGRAKDLLLRWTQLGAFNPVMENGGSGIHHPWAWDDEAVNIYRTFVNLHYALIPYLETEGMLALEQEKSLMDIYNTTDYRFLLGPDIFVAPFLEEGNEITVTYPNEDKWVYLFDTSKVYEAGSTETLNVPLNEYPVFIREGAPVLDDLLDALN